MMREEDKKKTFIPLQDYHSRQMASTSRQMALWTLAAETASQTYRGPV
jgi:hypothetical protein